MILDDNQSGPDQNELLSIPSSEDHNQICRDTASYKNMSDKYLLWDKKDVTKQYFNMYAARLNNMRAIVEKVAAKKWEDVCQKRLHELNEDAGRCVIVGTIYKRQELKPSILKEISDENSLVPQPILEKFTGDDDQIILEDELQRIQLVGNINVSKLVTGIICAVLGKEEGVTGKFEVEDICFAGLPEPIARPIPEDDKFVVIISGIELCDNIDKLLPLELLVDYITGQLGNTMEQSAIAKIVRVIVAGNSITGSKGDSKKTSKVTQVQEMDNIFAQIASVCPLDVMPGEYDPANHLLPQQPFHRCMFPKAALYSTMQSVTNPYDCEVLGRVMIGTSGQNIKDVAACSVIEDPLEAMECFCDWGHLAPTAPDTLKSYPFYTKEPFSIDSCPDVIFAGNQKSFKTKLVKNKHDKDILLVSVPKFSTTGTCALLNLRTLHCQPLVFDYEEMMNSNCSSPAPEK